MDDHPVRVARGVVAELFAAVWWAVLAGAVLTKARTPGSDLDIVVVVEAQPGVPYRRSLTRAGTPVELFVYDPPGLEEYLAQDLARRQPTLPRMCATGVLLTDPHPHHGQVRGRCARVLAAGPAPLTEGELAALRYQLTDLLDDLAHSSDPGETAVIAAVCWLRTAELALIAGGHWLGSGKWLLRELRGHDPRLAQHWLATAGDPTKVAALARQVLDHSGPCCSTATTPAANHSSGQPANRDRRRLRQSLDQRVATRTHPPFAGGRESRPPVRDIRLPVCLSTGYGAAGVDSAPAARLCLFSLGCFGPTAPTASGPARRTPGSRGSTGSSM